MSNDPETTATNWRAIGARGWAWVLAHPQITIPAATFLLGLLIGWILG